MQEVFFIHLSSFVPGGRAGRKRQHEEHNERQIEEAADNGRTVRTWQKSHEW